MEPCGLPKWFGRNLNAWWDTIEASESPRRSTALRVESSCWSHPQASSAPTISVARSSSKRPTEVEVRLRRGCTRPTRPDRRRGPPHRRTGMISTQCGIGERPIGTDVACASAGAAASTRRPAVRGRMDGMS